MLRTVIDLNKVNKSSSAPDPFPFDPAVSVIGRNALLISQSGVMVDPDNYEAVSHQDAISIVFADFVESNDLVLARATTYGALVAMSKDCGKSDHVQSDESFYSMRVVKERFTSPRQIYQTSGMQPTMTINSTIKRVQDLYGKKVVIVPDYVGNPGDVTYAWSMPEVGEVGPSPALKTLRCVSSMYFSEGVTSDLSHDGNAVVGKANYVEVQSAFASDLLSAKLEIECSKSPRVTYENFTTFEIPVAFKLADPSAFYWLGLCKTPNSSKFAMKFVLAGNEATVLDRLDNVGSIRWAGWYY